MKIEMLPRMVEEITEPEGGRFEDRKWVGLKIRSFDEPAVSIPPSFNRFYREIYDYYK